MNMEIDKDKFRRLIRDDKMGAVLNQLSDIGNFLSDEALQHDIARLATKFQAANPAVEEGQAEIEAIKNELLRLIDQLPEDFEPGGDGSKGKGCLGLLMFMVFGILLFHFFG